MHDQLDDELYFNWSEILPANVWHKKNSDARWLKEYLFLLFRIIYFLFARSHEHPNKY